MSDLNTKLHQLYCDTYGYADRIKGTRKPAKPVKFKFLGLKCEMKVDYPDYTERLKGSRIYVWLKNESIYDNLMNRRNRPSELYKEIVRKAFRTIDIDEETYGKLRWSQKAGCSMCPCSPGFIIDGIEGWTFHISVESQDEDVAVADINAPKPVVLL